MNASASIEGLQEVLADEALFPGRMGHRDPRSPSFIFFDDDREIDPEVKAFRDDLLDFEEWNAGREAPTNETVELGMFTIHRDVREWDEPDAGLENYRERQEARSKANWTIGFHKRMLASPSNDRFHKIIRTLGCAMTDMDDEIFSDPKLKALHPVVNLRNILKKRVKFAPGPIDGTVFINPDGSRFATTGTNPGSAKASFIKRHNLEETFVSVDRVQYEGQRNSHYVVGTRKASDQTPSNYYDPNPSWRDFEGGSYAPRACAIFRVGPQLTMPIGSHRLTIREFEQALIAGADCFDDADEALAGSIESDFMSEGAGYFEENDSDPIDTERLYDGRVSLMETGLGNCGRSETSFTPEEDYLMGILRMIGAERECELMTLANQEPNMIHRSMMSNGSYDGVVSLLQFVAKDNPEYLEFITKAICGDETLDQPEPLVVESYSDAVALFDDDADSWSIPTGPNGACRLGKFRSWK